MKKEDETINPFPEDWLKRFNEEQLERLAIMTVDGGLSDDEALAMLEKEACRCTN